jgi:predicted GTPase
MAGSQTKIIILGAAGRDFHDFNVLYRDDPAIDVAALAERLRTINRAAPIVRGASPVTLDDAGAIAGRRVLVIEDGPTITHGGMPYGAGYVAARAAGALALVDPRDAATPALRRVFERFPHIGPVLPAMGYDAAQLSELQATIAAVAADVVVSATPVDLGRLIRVDKKLVRARYAFAETGEPRLSTLVDGFIARLANASRLPVSR